MTPQAFETLCHRACLALGLADPYALGKGHTVTLDEVHLEAQNRLSSPGFLLLAEIARFPEETRATVHEHLLALQLSTPDHPNLRFGYHPTRSTTLLCLSATPPRNDATPEAWMARLLRDTASQVRAWRHQLLESGGKATAAPLSSHDFLQHASLRA
jgi:hypothetical protein